MIKRSALFALAAVSVGQLGCSNADVDAGAPGSVDTSAIVNGFAVTIDQVPYQLSLQSGGFAFCGASLIAPDWALTAQHCVEGVSAGQVEVVGGMTRLSQGGTTRFVSQIIREPGYSSPENGSDAALLRLESPFTLSSTIATIELVSPTDANNGATDPGVSARASGWGALDSQTQQSPDQLRAVDVDIRSLSEAEGFYGSLTDDQIPAGGDNNGGDSCQGDSGGPLAVDIGGEPHLAGVVSWGNGCADGFPGMYARVSALHSWITSTMEGAPIDEPDGVDGWMCDPSWLGDFQCDCGCGAFDNDCPSNDIGSCQFNNCDFWQPTQGLELNSQDPTQCEGGIGPDPGDPGDGGCPPNSSLTPDGAGCACNDGFEPDPTFTECVPVGGGLDCPANSVPTGASPPCECVDGFHPNAEGEACVPDVGGDGGDDDDDDNVGAQNDDDDDDDDRRREDPPGCSSTSSAPSAPLPYAALAAALLAVSARRRRR